MARFDDRVVLVTGGAQGIGLATVREFLSEGATVVAFDVDELALAEAAAGTQSDKLVTVAGDVGRRDDVRRAVGVCLERSGRIDCLVAVAGTACGGDFLSLEDEDWHRVQRVNVDGVFYALQEAARPMAAAGGGSMIVVASTNAFWMESNMAPYNTSKGAAVALAKSAAVDLARRSIRVNVVAPGVVRTRLSRFLTEDATQAARYLERVPLRRFAEPRDVARWVLFLASEDAAYLTGHTLVLDGGATVGIELEVPDADFPGFAVTERTC